MFETEESKIRKPRKQFSIDTKCPECEIVFTERGTMVKHHRSQHEGARYPCNDRDYEVTVKGSLRRKYEIFCH